MSKSSEEFTSQLFTEALPAIASADTDEEKEVAMINVYDLVDAAVANGSKLDEVVIRELTRETQLRWMRAGMAAMRARLRYIDQCDEMRDIPLFMGVGLDMAVDGNGHLIGTSQTDDEQDRTPETVYKEQTGLALPNWKYAVQMVAQGLYAGTSAQPAPADNGRGYRRVQQVLERAGRTKINPKFSATEHEPHHIGMASHFADGKLEMTGAASMLFASPQLQYWYEHERAGDYEWGKQRGLFEHNIDANAGHWDTLYMRIALGHYATERFNTQDINEDDLGDEIWHLRCEGVNPH